jgi:hypothetical protein
MNQAVVTFKTSTLWYSVKNKIEFAGKELSSVNINFNSSNDQITLKPSVIFQANQVASVDFC